VKNSGTARLHPTSPLSLHSPSLYEIIQQMPLYIINGTQSALDNP